MKQMKTCSWNKCTEQSEAVRLKVESLDCCRYSQESFQTETSDYFMSFLRLTGCFSLTGRENFPNVVDFNISVLFVILVFE